jgi:DNA-binding LacI/PurR family transcriptional regulator
VKKGVTIKDIAKRLNMSISTVSKALSNDPSISVLTKERVNKLAQEWNYVPNESARHFKLNKSFTVGLIIPNLLDQFYVLAINGVEGVAEKENYNVILSQSHEDVGNEEKITNVMIRNRVDGVIVAITKNTVDMLLFQKLISIGIPVVCISREPKGPSFNYVSCNNLEGAYKATDFLIKKGHRRIAHIMGPTSMQTSQVNSFYIYLLIIFSSHSCLPLFTSGSPFSIAYCLRSSSDNLPCSKSFPFPLSKEA